jgi:hypothetical protein
MKRWWIAGLVAVITVVLCLLAAVRYFTGDGFIEKQLATAIASAGGVNRVAIGSSSLSLWRASYVAQDLEYLPDTLLIAQRTQAGTPTRTRYSVTASSLRVHGIRRWSLLRGRIVADSVSVDGARVDVYLDRTAGPSPPVKPATLPHVSFQSIDRPIEIGVIRVSGSEISYSEKAKDGGRPGTIRFTDLWATVYNVANDSTRMTPSTPCTIDLRARIAGAGRLNATFDYHLLSPRLRMTYRGAVARMATDPLNELLVDLEGIRITSGVVDSTWFDFVLSDDVASGKMQVLYHDLGFEVLDKVTMDRGLTARFQTFMANETQLKRANPIDEQTPARVVAILRERTPETPLLKFMWEALREGLLSSIGI